VLFGGYQGHMSTDSNLAKANLAMLFELAQGRANQGKTPMKSVVFLLAPARP